MPVTTLFVGGWLCANWNRLRTMSEKCRDMSKSYETDKMINLQLDTSVTFQSAGNVLTALIYTHWPLYLRIHAPSGLNGLTGLHENESSLICRSMSIRNDNNKTLIIDYKIVPVMYPQLNAHTDVNISQLFVANLYYSPTLLQSQQ